MNRMFADRNGKPIDNKENPALKQVRKMIERQNAASIVDYYTNGQQKGVRM